MSQRRAFATCKSTAIHSGVQKPMQTIRDMLAFGLCMALTQFAVAPRPLIAQDSSAESGANIADADLQSLRASAEAFADAFNRHDAAALAAMWTPDGEYTSEEGARFEGRDAIRRQYEEFFAANDDIKMRVAVESIRLLSPTTAIEEGRTTLVPMPPGAPGASQYTALHVKQDGRWLLASVRDTRVEIPSTYGHNARSRIPGWRLGVRTRRRSRGSDLPLDRAEELSRAPVQDRLATAASNPHQPTSSAGTHCETELRLGLSFPGAAEPKAFG